MSFAARLLAVASVAVGCSSADFDVAEGPGADTAVSMDTAIDTSEAGPVEDSAQPTDTITVSDGGGGATCAAVTNPSEIWVDTLSTFKSPTGSSTCPFRRVGEAVAYVNTLTSGTPRTIRVRAGIYNESTAVILRDGVTLAGAGVGLTEITGGGPCTTSTTGYKCVVRVDGGATLERVTINAAPGGKHGVVTGATDGAFPTVRSTAITGASGSCCAGILATSGAMLGPNIESSRNGYGLVIWGNQPVKVVAGTNKFDFNTVLGINHEGTGAFAFEGGSVSDNTAGIRLGEPVPPTPPTHEIKALTALRNVEYGIRVNAVASAVIRGSKITGSKFGVIANHGATNHIDLGTTESAGENNFGNSAGKNSLGALCTLFTRASPLQAVGNTFPNCSTARNIGEVSMEGGCDDVKTYNDVWFRGVTAPVTTRCTPGS